MSDIGFTVLGGCFIFFMTCLGGALVFFFKKEVSQKIYSLFLGFASGLMVAASIWSLILPALDGASSWGSISFLPVAVGIILGVGFLILLDIILPKILSRKNKREYSFSKA